MHTHTCSYRCTSGCARTRAGNVLLEGGPGGRAKLCDFGLARFVGPDGRCAPARSAVRSVRGAAPACFWWAAIRRRTAKREPFRARVPVRERLRGAGPRGGTPSVPAEIAHARFLVSPWPGEARNRARARTPSRMRAATFTGTPTPPTRPPTTPAGPRRYEPSTVAGSPAYMAPEQLLARPLGLKTDSWCDPLSECAEFHTTSEWRPSAKTLHHG